MAGDESEMVMLGSCSCLLTALADIPSVGSIVDMSMEVVPYSMAVGVLADKKCSCCQGTVVVGLVVDLLGFVAAGVRGDCLVSVESVAKLQAGALCYC